MAKAKFYITYWLQDKMEIHAMNSTDFLDAQIEGKKALEFLYNLGARNVHITDEHGYVIYEYGKEQSK